MSSILQKLPHCDRCSFAIVKTLIEIIKKFESP